MDRIKVGQETYEVLQQRKRANGGLIADVTTPDGTRTAVQMLSYFNPPYWIWADSLPESE